MTASDVASGDEPYKFLDSYGPGDHDIFVSRDREVETLVGDVISSRLVVLFAKTGTGKTSLINAGVRPRLADLDYETFYARVEHDPVDAVRNVLRNEAFSAQPPQRIRCRRCCDLQRGGWRSRQSSSSINSRSSLSTSASPRAPIA